MINEGRPKNASITKKSFSFLTAAKKLCNFHCPALESVLLLSLLRAACPPEETKDLSNSVKGAHGPIEGCFLGLEIIVGIS